uniref:Nephronectin a n=1 Tax=Poecilia formosa TaxID=48698 RepID=A0A087XE92_POEFO
FFIQFSLIIGKNVYFLGRTERDGNWTDQAVLSDGLCHYGNGVECCWGWRRTGRGRCQPDCQQGCKHGDCVGPDSCKCHPGYTGKACNQDTRFNPPVINRARGQRLIQQADMRSERCVSDLNECGVKPRPCKHRCMNTAGSFKCFCLDGFALQPDGSCRNVRTCFHANCQYGCEVMKGEVRCTCPSPGLRLGPDRRSCVDIDECALGAACPRRRKCVNTFGSFFCKCHLGFKLTFIDGRYACIVVNSVNKYKNKDTRPFCSLNPSSPKCRCKDGSCKGILRVTLEPHRPRTSTTVSSTAYQTTAALTTTVIATTSMATSTVAMTTRSPITQPATTVPTTPPTVPATAAPTTPTPLPATAATTAAQPTVAIATTTLPSSTGAVVTTTLNNRINKDVTQRQRGDVHIPRQPGQNHVWEFDIELGNTAQDAQDDPGTASWVSAQICSFSRGVCSWISERDGDLSWESVDAPAGGRYLSVPELKEGQRSVRGARLAVQILPPWNRGDACFSFSHWLTGRQVGVLQLFVRKKGRYGSALWSRTGGQGWRQTQVTLETQSVDKVSLKAERRPGRRGQIAVDDVTLRRGACR